MGKKILISLCLFMILVTGLPARTYAQESVQASGYIPIEPFWSHTISITATLQINTGRATMAGMVIAHSGTERISVDALLERVYADGTTTRIVSWSNIEATGSIWAWERVRFVARGHYYRLTLTATVFRNGGSETVSMSKTTWAS